MWKYRDWVIKALNDDMPFDQFTIEQIAGDMLPNADDRSADRQRLPPQHAAQPGRRHRRRGGALGDAGRSREHDGARSGWASTIACAQCHNHKYDPFSQRDYYRLLAFFDNVEYTVIGQQGGDHWIQEPTLDLPTPEQEKKRERARRRAEDAQRAAQRIPTPRSTPRSPRGSRRCARPRGTWTPLDARQRRTPTTATLTMQDDGSVLASGQHPGRSIATRSS